MIITTTHSVDGYRIVKYFPPVVTNLVTGTGFLNDLAARFTDFLGGRSETYQAYLGDMYSGALRDLQSKAEAVGANCLVAATFDLDQISGKGMQMFMLNAVATPVTIKTDAQIVEDAEATQHAEQEREQREAERRQREAGRRERFAGVNAIQELLADEEIARQARKMKQMYGRDVCASFLKRKAAELGLEDIEVSQDDIPDSF